LALPAEGSDEAPRLLRVSTGEGRTTCAYFSADGERILYSSTHLTSPDCPPPPDRSQGYVWALYDGYEIFSAKPDGTDLVRLTDNDAYDAEATVCPVDGSIVFTSTRDGDLELYRMNADGSDVQRLTETPGYDGGAFFSADCSKIVWRASRPREGEELEEYRRLLAQGLVRPSQLEIWVAQADGSEARQITYLDAASFAPYFFPSGERVIFSSNYGDPRGREFELWAVDTDGTDLERITFSEQFDGFPIFSPDGRRLAFASNRNQERPGETNIFVADWVDAPPAAHAPSAADRYQADVAWLADDARQGRGIATPGLAAATGWLVERFEQIGLDPAMDAAAGAAGWLQPVEVPVSVTVGPATRLTLDGEDVAAEDYRPASFSASAGAAGEVVAAGYGITSEELGIDDYADLDAHGKIVVVRRFVPPAEAFEDSEVERRYSDLRQKAWNAREHGAVGLIVVDLPLTAEGEEPPEEAPLPVLSVRDGAGIHGDAGLPVVLVTRSAGAALLSGPHRAEMTVALEQETKTSHNVVGKIAAGAAERRPGAVVVGAHYDHLGLGGNGSLAPDSEEPHNGADDNASGVAALLEVGRLLGEHRGELRRDVYLVAFTGEESGLLGSTELTRHPPPGLAMDDLVAMINMDMVGRLRGNRLQVLGAESAEEWEPLVETSCREAGLSCAPGGDGYGPSDQTPFYAAGVPVLHLFTGTHEDYHKPSDDWPKINAAGGAQVARLAAELALALGRREEPLTLKQVPAPAPQGDVRSYGASLGTIPDYAGPEDGRPGVLLAGVRAGGAAEKAGLRRGDLLVGLAGHPIGDIYDFMFVLRKSKPGETVKAVVERGGERLEIQVTFGESRRMR
jgi:Tol biopolymer transport system component